MVSLLFGTHLPLVALFPSADAAHYAEAAAKIQDQYLAGHKKEAEALVPDRLIDEIALVGSADRIRDRLAAWKQVAKGGKLTTMVLTGASIEALRVVAEAIL